MSLTKFPAKRIEAAGIDTHYYDIGDGEPIVFIHGSGAGVSSEVNWWLNLEEVSQTHRAIAFDLVGFGQTVTPDGFQYGMNGWVRHVVGVLDALGLERAHLVGNSLGGWISLETALRHRDRVASLVLMGFPPGQKESNQSETLKSHGKYEPGEDAMRALLLDFVHDPSRVTDELVRLRFEASAAEGAAERHHAVVAARSRPPEPAEGPRLRARDLDVPTLLVHGREDRVVPITSSLRLFEILPNADVALMGNCGHWSQIEYPHRFNQLVVDHCTRAAIGNSAASA